MSHFFDLYVFTASLKEYADKIIDWIDPKGYIKKRFYRDVINVFYSSLAQEKMGFIIKILLKLTLISLEFLLWTILPVASQ